jgi:hypothetical protein
LEPAIQVEPEAAVLDGALQVHVGGGDHAHVGLHRCRRADAHHHAVLQIAQHADPDVQREVADLVEEHRAVVGGLEDAGLVAVGPGVPCRCRSRRQ